MPLDLSPTRFDLRVYPGNDHTFRLIWPSSLAGRTFSATMGSQAADVSIAGAVMTLTFSDVVTSAVTSTTSWKLTETTGAGPQVVITGLVSKGTYGTSNGSTEATVVVDEETVTIQVLGAGMALQTDLDAEEAARIAGDALKVDKATLNANTVLAAVVDDTPVALPVPASTVVGRKATGDVTALTAADIASLLTGTYVDRFINLTHPNYGMHPDETGLFNSEAFNQAVADGKAEFGSEGFTLYLPPLGTYMVDPTMANSGDGTDQVGPTLDGDNIALWLPKGATLKAIPNSLDRYVVLSIRYPAVGCSVFGGGAILGDLAEHTGTTGQAGHCIRIGGAVDTSIDGLSLALAWGDGLYVGENWVDAEYHRPSGLSVTNLTVDDVRREGIGHFNCDEARYVNVRIRNIGATATARNLIQGPQRGFDCEPNVGTPTESVTNLTVIGMHISGCQGAGFAISGGQGAVIDTVTLDDIQCWDNGQSANFNADWGIELSNILNLHAGVLTAKGNPYDYGVDLGGENTGHIESIVSTGNLGGLRIDNSNGTVNSDLSIGMVRATGNQQRGLLVNAGPTKDIRIGMVECSGNALAGGYPEARLAGAGGRVVVESGRIARAAGSATYLLETIAGTGPVVRCALVGTGTAGLVTDVATGTEYGEVIEVWMSDEVTVLTTGAAKVTSPPRPYAMRVVQVRSSLTTASSSGLVTVDINKDGVSILSTKLTIDANELTSATAVNAAVIFDDTIPAGAVITFDIDAAGTGAAGLKVMLLGVRV